MVLFSSGFRGCTRGGSDDPWWSVCFYGSVWLWHSEYHTAHPEPDPCHASTPSHSSSRGDLLSASQNGWLIPHLFQVKGPHFLPKYVPWYLQCLQRSTTGKMRAGLGFEGYMWPFNHSRTSRSSWHTDVYLYVNIEVQLCQYVFFPFYFLWLKKTKQKLNAKVDILRMNWQGLVIIIAKLLKLWHCKQWI